MKFKKLITINWGIFPSNEYPLSDITALTGETGVGKSSLGDAIQTIMGAALKNIIVYNAGQDESQNKKRDKEYRSLEGYIAGEDQFRFARPEGCTGVIALVFQSSPQEPERLFSAIMNASVSFEIQKGEKVPKIDELKFFIVKNTEVFMEDFTAGEERRLYNHAELHGRLAQQYGKNNVIEYRGKEDFLNGLYGHLWGKETVSPIYAKRAAKAFCNFINAKPVDDINSFVRNEFLEPKNMRDQVQSLSEALRSLDRARQEARETEDGIRLVDRVLSESALLMEKWYKNKQEHFSHALYSMRSQSKKFKEYEKKFAKAETDIEKYEKEIKELNSEIKIADENISMLNSKMGEDESFKNYKTLEQSVKDSEHEFKKLKSNFLIPRTNELNQLRNDVRNILAMNESVEGIHDVLSNLGSILDEISDFSFFQYFSSKGIDHENMHTYLRNMGDSMITYFHALEMLQNNDFFTQVRNNIEKGNEKNIALRSDLSDEKSSLIVDIGELEKDIPHLPTDKKEALEKLKECLPDIQFKMLYEHTDIKEEYSEWREAIEGFLNHNRYAIIVEPEHEISALNVVRDQKLNLNVIQGQKVLDQINKIGKSVKENSIANFFRFTHPVAEAYILATYQNVLAIDDPVELKKVGRGIMKDCRAANANTMFTCRLRKPFYVFGAEGRIRTLKIYKERLETVKQELNKAERERGVFRKIVNLFNALDNEIKNTNTNTTMFDNLITAFEQYRKSKNKLTLMDTTDFQAIQEEIQRYTNGKDKLEKRKTSIIENIGEQKAMIRERKTIENNLKNELQKKEDAFAVANEEYKQICRLYLDMNEETFEEHTKRIGEELAHAKSSPKQPEQLGAAVVNEWSSFFQHYTSNELADAPKVKVNLDFPHTTLVDSIDIFQSLVVLRNKFEQEKSSLEHAQAFVHRKKIEEANEKFERTFINDFCNTIHIHIQEGRDNIINLNNALKKHSFENDKFAVSTLDPDPELKEYKRYFQAIFELKEAASEDSLLSAIYDDEYKETTQKLTELIKNNDKRGAELDRLSDYRNYYNYDIIQTNGEKEISLSKNGKMSGGQGETSYYVIRSINLHAALKAKDMSGNALEAVFMDESFGKTNEGRAKEIIEYVNGTMGFQIIFAMPTKHIGSLLNINLDNYHFTKMPLMPDEQNGELDYKIWVQNKKLDGKEIKKLYEKEALRIRKEVEAEAEEIFG